MKISLIVPVVDYDEPAKSLFGAFDEVIVIDGGTFDGTASRVRKRGGIVIDSPRGRGTQMNLGADAATGDVLLFVHSDTELSSRSASLIRQAITSGAVGGCFETVWDERGPLYRLGDAWRNFRARWLRYFYGDQSIFIRRDLHPFLSD